MDQNFESRVWQKALNRGLLTSRQVNDCLKESHSTAPTLRLTEVLVAKGFLEPDQVREIRAELALAEPEAPDEVRAAARDPQKLLGRYVIVGELGRGGMGIVYKAWDGDLRRFVALKVLSGPWDDEDLARFRREAQSAAALRHPNIITVYEIGDSGETPFIALELIDGRTLHGRKLPSRKAAEIMIVIARAVEAAHRRGIIHRDLKPHNIMVDAEGRPRVMDFGLAKPVRSSSQVTVSGTVVGTPAYMSPEQAQGRVREVDHRSDLFSLGAMLYELLTGKAPFGGRTPLETLTAVVEQNPVPPRKLAPSVPRPLEAVILTCLQKDKTRRYSSAEALARDLERFMNGERVIARVPVPAGRLLFAVSAGIAFAAGLAALFWPPAAPPPAPLPPPPPPPARAKPVDRDSLDRSLHLLEEARLDLYRANADLGLTRVSLDKAIRFFNDALEADPASGPALLARGQALQRLNRGAEAEADFSRAIQRLPSSPAAYLARGRLLLERFMTEMIAASWKEDSIPDDLVQVRLQATRDFLKARELGAPAADLPYLEGSIAFTEFKFDRVIERVASALPAATMPEEFLRLRGDTRVYMSDKSTPVARGALLKDAIDDYTEALRLRVNYVEALRMRGAALWQSGRPEDAFKDFQAVIRLNPYDSQALSDLATYYQRNGEVPEAERHLERAIAADPRNFRAFSNRASLRLSQNKPEEAKADAEQALKISPYYTAALANLASACYKLKQPKEAIARFTELLDRVPSYTRARMSRGVIYHDLGLWKEALEDFERCAAEMPAESAKYRPLIEDCRRRLGR